MILWGVRPFGIKINGIESIMKQTHITTSLACVLLSTGVAVAQQTAPDAGRILQQVTPPAPALPQGGQVPRVPVPAPSQVEAGGPEVSVRELRFSGNTIFDQAQLKSLVDELVGDQSLDMAGLEKLTDKISEHYRMAGYPYAMAYLPEQNLDDGVLRIDVIEGRFGRVEVKGDNADHVLQAQPYLQALKPGDVITQAPMERATLLLGDLPGVVIDSVLSPGQSDGEGDLSVNLKSKPGYNLEAGVDNHGGYYSGLTRGRMVLNVDSPLMLGDQFTANLLRTDMNLWLGGLNYSLPLGAAGWRGQIGYLHTRYVLGREFQGSDGTAKVGSLGVSYAWIRSLQTNVRATVTLQSKQLYNNHEPSGASERYSSKVLPLALQFDHIDLWGVSTGSVTWSAGSLTKEDVVTQGRFNKFNLELSRSQSLMGKFSLYGRYSQQRASKNLDSSERMSLGGVTGVRAYAASEGYGDEGWLTQFELRHTDGATTTYAFYDYGHIRVNAKPELVDLPSPDVLKAGAGFGVRVQEQSWVADAALAWRTHGGAPVTEGTRDPKPRLWFNLAYKF